MILTGTNTITISPIIAGNTITIFTIILATIINRSINPITTAANIRISITMAKTSIIDKGTIALIGCTCEIGELGQITAGGACTRIHHAVFHARNRRVQSTIAPLDLRHKFKSRELQVYDLQ